MSASGAQPAAVALGVFLVGSAITAIAATVVAVERVMESRHPGPRLAPVARPVAAREPIRAEAQVFRTTPGMLAIEPTARRERSAHPRTLRAVRFLRAFPGAPPVIPHPLSAEEFRTVACKTCHERGGYSERFAAYVPLTPHPERGICLQCHLGVDSVIGVAGTEADPNARCPMCHGPSGGPARREASPTWATTGWPKLPRLTLDRDPPPIPHDLRFRENCLTCHAGPAAALEIRTRHPERANCRQCHLVLEAGAETYARPPSRGPAGRSVAP
ncbi:MAG TPA: hypothetical protein VNJ71_09785 [Gemmatimonadales bacterium]|nr:hypothetical protein [Gemmatimonadales bacterium]